MKRHFILGTLFSAALAVGVSAQSSAPPAGQADKQDTKGSAAQTLTVTGCLKSADASSSTPAAPGAPASPGASSSAGGFILTDASPSASAAASPTEAAPSPTATSGTGTTYRLSGSSSDFSSLVGKKVEIKGTLQNRASSGAGAAESPAAGAAMGDASKAPQLRVSSVKEVPGTCSK